MDFIRISKKHSFWSSLAYIFLNILLAVAVWLSVYISKTAYIGLILVLVSKWRAFAVRPRFWLANAKSNMVDLIFSLSITILMWATGVEFLASQLMLVVFYAAWLTLLKPRSDEISMKTQSLLAVFFGLTALLSAGYNWIYGSSIAIVFFAFVIGYSSIRHILSIRENPNIEIISIFWGLIFAEMAWFANFLVVAYSIKIGVVFNFFIPQFAIIATAMSLAIFEFFTVNKKGEDKKIKELSSSIIFATLVSAVLLLAFSAIK